MTATIDFAGIGRAALSSARLLLPKLIPGGKFSGQEYVVRNPRRADQRPGSFKINFTSGLWKDFSSNEGGGDFISLAAYVWACNQGDAARRLADDLGVPATKHDRAATSNGSGNGRANDAPQMYSWGDEGPPEFAGEIRRHVYRLDCIPVQIKIKKRVGVEGAAWTSWFRVFGDGTPIGWQAKKPKEFPAVPYVSTEIDPFDLELKDDAIFWPEGEKDVDALGRVNLPDGRENWRRGAYNVGDRASENEWDAPLTGEGTQ